MKIILSRKGFDSSAGGIACPIMPDGRLLSLPIPQADGPVKFSQLSFQGKSISSLIKQLGCKEWRSSCHLDPDLMPELIERPEGWYPTLGQHGAAQRHLETEGVGPGDLFLFFGWFRQTEWFNGKLRFVANAPDLHLFYGWLQIDRVVKEEQLTTEHFPELGLHPHLVKAFQHNGLYLPKNQLVLNSTETEFPGAGFFSHFNVRKEHEGQPIQQLTFTGEKRTVWQLPECFWPENCDKVLSYHRKPERWIKRDDRLLLQSAFRGQEFVLESNQPDQVKIWLNKLLSAEASVKMQ